LPVSTEKEEDIMEKDKNEIAKLYEKKASIIEQVMKLRHDQAKIKVEIARVATLNNDFSLIASQPRCW
jgi:hypothetical protein